MAPVELLVQQLAQRPGHERLIEVAAAIPLQPGARAQIDARQPATPVGASAQIAHPRGPQTQVDQRRALNDAHRRIVPDPLGREPQLGGGGAAFRPRLEEPLLGGRVHDAPRRLDRQRRCAADRRLGALQRRLGRAPQQHAAIAGEKPAPSGEADAPGFGPGRQHEPVAGPGGIGNLSGEPARAQRHQAAAGPLGEIVNRASTGAVECDSLPGGGLQSLAIRAQHRAVQTPIDTRPDLEGSFRKRLIF